MELQEELFDVKDVFTSVNAQDARAYVNKNVYLSSSLAGLRDNVAKNRFVTLDCILDDDNDRRFVWDDMEYSLCLPLAKVKHRATDKKYRPFKDLAELKEVTGFHVGSSVKLKVYNLDHVLFIESETLIVDMDTTYCDLDGSVIGYNIYLGTDSYTLEELLSHFKYMNPKTNEWQPFGIAEEE